MKYQSHHYLTIYRNIDFIPTDNIVFDDIQTHLSLFSKSQEIDIGPNRDFDSQKINIVVKIDTNLFGYIRTADYWIQLNDYVAMRTSSESTNYQYYFVTDAQMLSEGVMQLSLQKDVLNSYASYITDSDYWSTRTLTTRQHKDRFESNHYPKFDKFDEGLGSLPMYKVSDTKLLQNNENVKWYLVYQSEGDDSNSPIKCKAYTDVESTIKFSVQKGRVFSGYGNSWTVYWNTLIHSDGKPKPLLINGEVVQDCYFCLIDLENRLIYYGTKKDYYNSWYLDKWLPCWGVYTKVAFDPEKNTCVGQVWDWYSEGVPLTTIGYSYAYHARGDTTSSSFAYVESGGELFIYGNGIYTLHNDGTNEVSWKTETIDVVDRTQSTLNKIVECPYCPFQYSNGTISGLTLDLSSDISDIPLLDSIHKGPIPINAYNTTAFNSLVTTIKSLTSIQAPSTRTQSDTKSIEYETKLLTSQFHKFKFTYDSFTKEIKPELFNSDNQNIYIYYNQSLDMSSKLMFKFDMKYQEYDDYDKYLVCSRNNETPVYTSSYLNYLRTGYNYDMKSKSLTDIKNGMSITSSVVGLGLGVASGIATGGMTGLMVANQTTGLVNNIANVVLGNIANENSIQQKKDEALASSVGVTGVDDLSLLNLYNGNKLHQIEYSIRDELKNCLYEQFYLTGYACNDYGRPNLKSRQNFNYIKASTTIDTLIPITLENKNAIVEKIGQGILIIHKCSDAIGALFNYENWETSI